MLWVDKYKPKKLEDIKGQNISKLKDFVINFKTKKNKALLIYGPTGCGKTSSIYALASFLNLELLELNASDFRNKESIESIAGNASKQRSLFKKGKIILIDEVEGISGNQDRGGLQSIISLIQSTSFPIILTTNDIDLEKLESLKKKVDLLEFIPVMQEQIYLILENICKKEKISYDESSLSSLSRYANGDVRGIINDLQLLTSFNKTLDKSYLDELDARTQNKEIQQLLLILFKSKDPLAVINSFDNTDIFDFSKISDVIYSNDNLAKYWIEENLPLEYNGIALVNAFNYLSKSSVFQGRIHKQQYWRLLSYSKELILGGIALSKQQKNPKVIKYKKTKRCPKNNFKLWGLVSRRKKVIISKIQEQIHGSYRRINNDFPYLKLIIVNNPEISNKLNLTDEELMYLQN